MLMPLIILIYFASLFFERRYLMHCYQSIRTGRMSRDKSK